MAASLLMKRSAFLYVLYALIWVVSTGVASAVTVEVAHVGAPSDSAAVVPISLAGAGGESIVAVEVTVTYDPTVAQFDSLSSVGCLLESWASAPNSILLSTIVPGPVLDTLKVAGATGDNPLSADGTLLNLHFTMNAFYTPTIGPLALEYALVNAGSPPTTAVDGSLRVTGIDGTIEVSPQWVGSDMPVSATVSDPEANRDSTLADSLSITVQNGADFEAISALETGNASGLFEATIDVAFDTTTTAGDGIVQAQPGDSLAFCFDDSLDSNGDTVPRCATVLIISGTPGSVELTNAAQPADTLRVKLQDPDLNLNSSQPDSIRISLSNSTTGETETVLLNETGDSTDVFIGRAFTALGTGVGTVGDTVLNMQRGDLILADYLDLAAGVGVAVPMVDTCQVLDPWGDASGNGQLRGFDAAEILAHVVGSAPLSGLDSLSANLDELAPYGAITSFDASLVLQKRVGLINVFPVQLKTSANHPQPESSTAPKRVAVERMVDVVRQGDHWVLRMDQRDGIVAGQLFIENFNGRIVAADDLGDYLVVWRRDDNGLHVALAGAQPLAGSGPLLHLHGSDAPPQVRAVRFNDGRILGQLRSDFSASRPASFRLLSNVPNPFNPETLLRYELPGGTHVRLTVFNALGQHVRTLVDQPQVAGSYAVRWNGRDARGVGVAGGIYFYRLEAGQRTAVRKMVLLQ